MDPSSGDVKPVIVRRPVVAGAAGPALLRGWKEFRRSGAPARFLCFEKRAWVDVAGEAAAQLRRAFQERRAFAEAAYGGREFLFDFLRMVRIDTVTAEETAVGWIDDRGSCFFPAPDGGRKRKRGHQAGDGEDEAQSSGVEERSGESRGTGGGKKARGAWDGAVRLEETDRHYHIVSKLFNTYGMGREGAVMTAVRKVAHGTPRGQAFQKQGQLLAASRGAAAATAKFAWYGATARDVSAAVAHGFTRPNALLLGASAHGDGMHLSPPQCPYTSATLAQADENGELHIVLCRVLMGQPEAVPAGSSQSRPSSDDYDCAVDDMSNPKWYIVWSKDMNTRILPQYVVSFKCPKLHIEGSSEATSKLTKPSPLARDMFPTLLAEIQSMVPSYKCQTVRGTYKCFKNGQMKKDQFIQFLRNYIGDKVLTTVAKKLRGL